MLNVEYLTAEFYACATTGVGLAAPLRLGGPPSIGCQQAVLTGTVAVRLRSATRLCCLAHGLICEVRRGGLLVRLCEGVKVSRDDGVCMCGVPPRVTRHGARTLGPCQLRWRLSHAHCIIGNGLHLRAGLCLARA